MTRSFRPRSTRGPRSYHGTTLSARESLLFEAGIKLGGVFHQYLGTPVSRGTARELARTIERAVRLQPYVRAVSVVITPGAGGRMGTGAFRYRYLTAEMLRVRVTLADGPVTVVAELAHRPELRYPLMRVVTASPGTGPSRPRQRPTTVPRSGRT